MLKIAVTGTGYTEAHFRQLKDKQFEVLYFKDPLSAEALKKILPEVDAYILGGDERLDEQALQLASRLRVISFVGTGFTSFINANAAKKYEIAIKNTPAVMAPAVAEHTLGLLIGLKRQLFKQNREVKQSGITPCQTEELGSLCIGIVGLGAIGSLLARILRQSFGSEVIYTARTRKETTEKLLDIQFSSMQQLFEKSDVIVLALPTTEETTGFVNEALLTKSKKGVVIINTAGAQLIDPRALKKFLENGQIAAAAFDGYYIEPLPAVAEDPWQLLSLSDDRFIITPHTAAKTKDTWIRMVDMAVDNITQFFE